MASIVGVETGYKPFPSIVHENQHLLAGVETALDIGAGSGRFAKYLLLGRYTNRSGAWELKVRPSIKTYVAVEPYEPSCRKLKELNDPRLQVICSTWEEVRGKFAGSKFDLVILWDVAMFMDLRSIHGTPDPAEALIKELDAIVSLARRLFLFSLHPTRNCIVCRDRFKEVLAHLDNHRQLKLVGKRYLNRIYVLTAPRRGGRGFSP